LVSHPARLIVRPFLRKLSHFILPSSGYSTRFVCTNMATEITELSCVKCFGGFQKVYSHQSGALKCEMKFAVFIPPKPEEDEDEVEYPVLYWLSGLTCTEQNFITKAGAQKTASEEGILIVAPDTSPRGCEIEGEEDSWDFGTGASFYVDATEEPWKANYQMYTYITFELPALIKANFSINEDSQSIMGHSMGGHGALMCFLKNPGMYRSVSAFAPICNPINCPWGQKAFKGYLGEDEETWKEYDSCELVKSYSGPLTNILIDQGTADNFLSSEQLLPQNFVEACEAANMPIILRMQEDYDHSYYFIASFMDGHIKHHAQYLKA